MTELLLCKLQSVVPLLDDRIALRGIEQEGPEVIYVELRANTANDAILREHAYRCEAGDAALPTWGFRVVLKDAPSLDEDMKRSVVGAILTFQSKLDTWLN